MPPDSPDLRDQLEPLIRDRGVRATARTVGMHHGSLIAWLKGKRDISAAKLQELLNVFGLRVTQAPPGEDGKA